MTWTVESLREFETKVKDSFEAGKIKGPIHLSHGNEESLLKIFELVKTTDWVFSTWRNHYHALLHGISEEWLMDEILAGRSININNAEHKFYTSAIVGGILPIATGVARGIQFKGSSEHVWCFIGDMASTIGAFHESYMYASVNNLPITYVIEDNGQSTNSPTLESWGFDEGQSSSDFFCGREIPTGEYVYLNDRTIYSRYERLYPHVGVGKKIFF